MILVDPPLWPAHGTVFSHLVSDTSMVELHRFADRIGLNPRAYDRDHYDLPQRRYADAVAAGAVEVSPAQLVAALRRAGLRRPKPAAAARERRRRAQLRGRWARLLPDFPDLGRDLLAYWSQPQRRYHTVQHLAEMYAALEALPDTGRSREVELAAWFHDAVYEGHSDDEERSAQLAEELLDGLMPSREVAVVAALVRLTAGHAPEDFDPGAEAAQRWDPVMAQTFVDADLAILAATRQRYLEYARQVRAEYHHVSIDDFQRGRLAVLHSLSGAPALYRTSQAARQWDAEARANMAFEERFLLGH